MAHLSAPATEPVWRSRKITPDPRLNTSFDAAQEILDRKLDFDMDIDGVDEPTGLDGRALLLKLEETVAVFREKRDWYKSLRHRYFQRLAKVEIMLSELDSVACELEDLIDEVKRAGTSQSALRKLNSEVISIGSQHKQRLETVIEVLQEDEDGEDEYDRTRRPQRPQTTTITRHLPRITEAAPHSAPPPRRAVSKVDKDVKRIRQTVERQLDEVDKLETTVDTLRKKLAATLETISHNEEQKPRPSQRTEQLRSEIKDLIDTKAELEDLRQMEVYSRNLPPAERREFLEDILARLEQENDAISSSSSSYSDLPPLVPCDEPLGDVQYALYNRVRKSIEKYGDSPEFLLHIYREVVILPEDDPLRQPLLDLLFEARGKQLTKAAQKASEESDEDGEEMVGNDIDDLLRRAVEEDSDEDQGPSRVPRPRMNWGEVEAALDSMTRNSAMAGDETPARKPISTSIDVRKEMERERARLLEMEFGEDNPADYLVGDENEGF